MDKFKCIGLSLRTDDNNRRSNVQRKETVEYITTMVKFSLVKRISDVLMLGSCSLIAVSPTHLARNLQDSELLCWRRGVQLPQAWLWQRRFGQRWRWTTQQAFEEASRRRRPCLQGSCAWAARAGGRWQRQLGLREAEHQGFFEVQSSKDRQTPRVITACPRMTRMNTRSFQSSLAVGW